MNQKNLKSSTYHKWNRHTQILSTAREAKCCPSTNLEEIQNAGQNPYTMAYTAGIKGNDLTKEDIEYVLVKKFGETLTKGYLTCCSILPENSIGSFVELADTFIKAHSKAQ